MDDHSANLNAAIADLKRRRAEIDAAIASMETILATVYGVHSQPGAGVPKTPHHGSPNGARRGASRAEKVRRAFADQPGTIWNAETLAVEIGEEPDEQTVKAIHGILSRLRKAGLVFKLERGEYRSADPASSTEEADEPALVAQESEDGEVTVREVVYTS